MPPQRPQMSLPETTRRSSNAVPDLLATARPAPPRYRTTQVRITASTDEVIARLDAEWRRQGRPGHVSMSAVIRHALDRLDPAGDADLVRRLS